jgi:citrate synthase
VRNRYLSASEAAARLGVKPATLYAYVARGLLGSQPVDGSRSHRYLARDVDRLVEGKHWRKQRDPVKARSLFWGAPVVESAISLVEGGRLLYRGIDATHLAENESFERVAALLWSGSLDASPGPWPAPPELPAASARALALLPEGTTVFTRLTLAAALIGAHDELRFDTVRSTVLATAKRLIAGLARVLARNPVVATRKRPRGVAATLAASLEARGGEAGVRLVERALILCAEHELNASAFAARVAAGTGADPYAVVTAALATLSGPKHGGMCDRVEALIREVERPEHAARVVFARHALEEVIPGFGHPLYPEGEPRADSLMEGARAASAHLRGGRELPAKTVFALADAMRTRHDRAGGAPTLDLGLVAVASSLEMRPGSASAIFAIGRIVGLIAHALEQYAMDEMIRPRARYTGPLPETS